MGACPKCGKPRVRKNKNGVRRCARCGTLGKKRVAVAPTVPAAEPVEFRSAPLLRARWRSTEQGTT
jgi:ribosomal protein L37AE/L43A